MTTRLPARIEVGAMFGYKGEALRYPLTEAILFFFSTSKSFNFAENHELTVLIDGEGISFGDIDYKYEVKELLANERLFTFVSRGTLLKMANAKSGDQMRSPVPNV